MRVARSAPCAYARVVSDLIVLTDVDQRVLGALLEKEVTVPSSYPLTLNSLRTACNQTSSRDPVTDYDERQVEHVLSDLKLRGLVRFEHSASGSRVMKYRQLVTDVLGLGDDERAVMTVLLLRGAQSVGEIKTRTERLFGFADPREVEDCLGRLAARPQPLVREIPKRPGWRDPRWVHLLGADAPTQPTAAAETSSPATDLDPAPTMDPAERDARIEATYDTVAAAYTDMLVDELDHKPFDRWLLTRVAAAADGGPIIEIGCGPGHVAAFLASAGGDVTGIDLSAEMVHQARLQFPSLNVVHGSFRNLPAPEGADAWAAIVAWYAFVNAPTADVASTLPALAARLRPGGLLALAVHAGPEVRHVDDWWGHQVDIDFVFHDARALRAAVTAAGLTIDEWYIRSPLPEIEADTSRLYLLARRA